MCCGYCREQCLSAVGTVGNSVCAVDIEVNSECLIWVKYGTVDVCCGYFREQWLTGVGTVGKSGCVL